MSSATKIQDKLDQALTLGPLKLSFATKSDAEAWRFRAYTLRRVLRNESRKLFQPLEEGYNSTPYDGFLFKLSGAELTIIPLGPQILETTLLPFTPQPKGDPP